MQGQGLAADYVNLVPSYHTLPPFMYLPPHRAWPPTTSRWSRPSPSPLSRTSRSRSCSESSSGSQSEAAESRLSPCLSVCAWLRDSARGGHGSETSGAAQPWRGPPWPLFQPKDFIFERFQTFISGRPLRGNGGQRHIFSVHTFSIEYVLCCNSAPVHILCFLLRSCISPRQQPRVRKRKKTKCEQDRLLPCIFEDPPFCLGGRTISTTVLYHTYGTVLCGFTCALLAV